MLVLLIAIERIILSATLISLTITEWAFKSKISKDEKRKIYAVNSVHVDHRGGRSATTRLKGGVQATGSHVNALGNTQDISGIEDIGPGGYDKYGRPIKGGAFHPNYDSGDDRFPGGPHRMRNHGWGDSESSFEYYYDENG